MRFLSGRRPYEEKRFMPGRSVSPTVTRREKGNASGIALLR
jgi:hypothetical protein